MSERVIGQSSARAQRRWQITERDREILRFLLGYGMATAEQIRREFFGRSPNGAYRRLKALEELGLVRAERVFFGEPGVYLATEPGARLADVDLPPPRRYRERLYHTLEIVEHSWWLRQDAYEEIEEWVCERKIRHDRMVDRREEDDGRMGRGASVGRIPDGIAILSNGTEIAMELELTPKRKASYRRIFDSYERQIAADEVHLVRFYFTSRQTMRRVEAICSHHPVRNRVDFRHYEPVLDHRR